MKNVQMKVQETGGAEDFHSGAEDHHSSGRSGRSQDGVSGPIAKDGAQRTGDPGAVEEMVRPDDTVGPGGQGRAVTTSIQGGARVLVD